MGGRPVDFEQRRASTIYLLREGLGAEDIALKIGCPVECVRYFIGQLREVGALRDIYRRDGSPLAKREGAQ